MATTDLEHTTGRDTGAAPGAGEATAAEVVDLVRQRSRGAEAEVTVRTGVSALTRFASSFIHQNVAEDVSHVLLRVALDGHVASVTLDGPTDSAELTRLVDNAFEAAEAMPVDPDWPGADSFHHPRWSPEGGPNRSRAIWQPWGGETQ